ncbi:MAG: DnaD domain protein [Lachnospiraceae bacterium]|nr:DnaD domain protein [Lachnospiraceae bacterium]
MDKIAIRSQANAGTTCISNLFIDRFIKDANEIQLKVYIYLLRSIGGTEDISVSGLADFFNYSERDIERSLAYWERLKVISAERSEGQIVAVCMNDLSSRFRNEFVDKGSNASHIEESHEYASDDPAAGVQAIESSKDEYDNMVSGSETESLSPAASQDSISFYPQYKLDEFRERQDVSDLVFTTEAYLGRPLNSFADTNSLLYMYDELHFPVDLIEYLIEYCVNNGNRSMKYIEKTAVNWAEEGINTIEKAKTLVGKNGREYHEVLKAFGLGGRKPVQSDIDFIRKWKDEYGFSMDLILEAVNRTMKTISTPSFKYADSILKKWKARNISTKEEIEKLDLEFEQNQIARHDKTIEYPSSKQFKRPSHPPRNFQERTYDFAELERKLVKNGST